MPRALLSVSDKTGIVDLGRGLASRGFELVSTGGRVLSVVALGTTFAEARNRAYDAISQIELEGSQYRTDIAARVVD